LGYIVGGGTGEEAGNLFAYFVVQSANLGADAIEARATEFIAKLPGLLQKLDADAWKTLVAGARANLTERDKSVSERAGRLFALAYEHDADWARRESTLAALDQLTQQRAAVLLATALAPRTAQTRTFLGFGRGHEPASAPAVSFTDAQVWKKGRSFE
jgi:secreted Zn-dependent insulinase-like peptidase